MNDCNHYQTLLLEHLYGLLDDADNQALLEHLGTCASCQAALEQARRQQNLLATAAKEVFPAVRFEVPAEGPPVEVVPMRQQPAAPPRRARSWGQWAAAAAIFLTLGTAGGFGAWFARDYFHTRDAVRAHDQQVADARKKADRAGNDLDKLPQEELEKLAQVDQEARDRKINLVVSGPQRVQVGAPSEYHIATSNLQGHPVPARLNVRVVDDKGKTVHEEKDVKSNGDYKLTLQPNLPLPPNASLAMTVDAHREGDNDADSSLSEQLQLAAPVYVTHLATDRPMYQIGDTMRYRSLTLERFSLKPPPDDFHLLYAISDSHGATTDILNGSTHVGNDKGAILGPDGQQLRGLGAGEYALNNMRGGEYTLVVREANNHFPPQERKFLVNAYRPSVLNKDLHFDHSSYGAGEYVVTRLKLTRSNGDPADGCAATPNIVIDNKHYGTDGNLGGPVQKFVADDKGQVDVRFQLPVAMERGEASLTVALNDRTGADTIIRTIPIVLKTLQVDFYPEGGDLIAGADNRVYFQVRTTLDKPGDLHGQIVDDRGDVVVKDVHTLTDAELPGVNQGMGVFKIHPDSMRTYQLKIDTPLGVTGQHTLPAAKMDGIILKVLDGVTGPADPIHIEVCSPRADKTLQIGAYCRGRLLAHGTVTAKQGECAPMTLNPSYGVGGVYRITVFEEMPGEKDKPRLEPRAERLIYRQPRETLQLEVKSDKPQYIPGEKVKLRVIARNENQDRTGAVVLLSVVDKRTLMMADEKTARTMPTHFLLTTEVRKAEDLEYADFLLSADAKAGTALDLLLGTQGWRRFAEQNPQEFKNKFQKDQKLREDAERLVVITGQSSEKLKDFAEERAQEVAAKFATRNQELRDEHDKAAATLATVKDDPAAAAAQQRLQDYDDWLDRYGRASAPIAGVLLLLLLVAGLLLALPRSLTRTVPFGIGVAVASVVVFFVSLLPLVGDKGHQRESDRESQMARNDDRERDQMAAGAKNAAEAKQAAKDEGMAFGGAGMPQMAPGMAAGAMPGGGALPAPPAPMVADAANKDGKGEKKADDLQKNAGNWDRARNGQQQAFLNEQRREIAPGEAEKRMRAQADKVGGGRGGFGGGRRGGFPGGEGGFGGPMAMAKAPAPPPLIVREFAYENKTPPGALRSDFAETLLWQPALIIPASGEAEVSFDLCDSVTNFEVSAAGHTLDGRLGTTTAIVESRLPFALEPKVPVEISSRDRVDIPLTINNNTPDKRTVKLSETANGLEPVGDKVGDTLTVDGKSSARRLYSYRPKIVEGPARLEFRGQTEPFAADGITRTIRVVPDGFPVVGSKSDLLEGTAVNDVTLPDKWVPGTLKCRVEVYPSTLASLQKGLEAMLREPCGCFEQTSTSNYPNVLILSYLKESNQALPEVEARARRLLDDGYHKLSGFECPKTAANSKQGYEWFGAPDGAHEALTAYGLLQFRDMAHVYKVDAAMLDRTRDYLLASRDGKGGFTRNPRALDTFGRAPDNITNAYIVWAITESGKDDDVDKELKALNEQAKTSKDPYFLALVANSLLNRGRSAEAAELLKKVAEAQKEDGHLDAERTSITGSAGRDLQIETTALAVLGWLKINRPSDFVRVIDKSVKWIGQQRGGYGAFGATQSTILALKALIAHTRANKKTPEAGELTLLVGNQQVGRTPFPAGAQDVLAIEMSDAEKFLKPGKNTVIVRITGKNNFPYTLSWSYQTLTPVSAEGCPVRLTTTLDRREAKEGESVHLTVTLENLKDQGQGMAVAIIGLPAGLMVPKDMKQLKEHARLRENDTKPGLISAFELRPPRELVLYWRDLAPHQKDQKIEVPIDLVCDVPGEYRGPASRAYLYYNADAKHWVEPLSVKIAPAE